MDTSVRTSGLLELGRQASGPRRPGQHVLGLARGSVIALALVLFGVAASAQEWTYTVRPGDNLWTFAERHLEGIHLVERLRARNDIADPVRLIPGSRIRVPVNWLKVRPADARLEEVRGNVSIFKQAALLRTAANPRATGPVTATTGTIVGIGDRVVTDEDSTAVIVFADGSQLLVHESSEVEMNLLGAFSDTGMADTRLRLRRGRLENRTQSSPGSVNRFEITTPAAVATVRGTRFRVAADAQTARSKAEVTEGLIQFSGAGRTRRVPLGFGVTAEVGKPPEPPVELLPAPDLSALPEFARSMVFALDWPAVPGAERYRVMLYGDETRTTLLAEHLVTPPALEIEAPPDGQYFLRIRAIDAVGLEGLDGDTAVTVDARPIPPMQMAPGPDDKFHTDPPELWWLPPTDAAEVILEVARLTDEQEAAETLLLREGFTSGDRYRLAQLPPPGVYRWRVATRSASGELGPFGESRPFKVLEKPPPVEAEKPAVGEEALAFGWGPVAKATSYRLQVARDEAYEDMHVEQTMADTRASIERPPGGTYYFRVQGISDEGAPGPFSPSFKMDVPSDWPWEALLPPALLLLLL